MQRSVTIFLRSACFQLTKILCLWMLLSISDFIDIRNSINTFEDALQRQNNTTQSLSELIKKKQETSKIRTDKKISELQKEINVKRLTSPSSTSPRLTPPNDDFNSASATAEFPSCSNCNSSTSPSSTVHYQSLLKSLHTSFKFIVIKLLP